MQLIVVKCCKKGGTWEKKGVKVDGEWQLSTKRDESTKGTINERHERKESTKDTEGHEKNLRLRIRGKFTDNLRIEKKE